MSEVPPRPALPALLTDQKELLDHTEVPRSTLQSSLKEGFDSRRELIVWYQSALVRTFGRLADSMAPVDLERDRVLLQAMIVSDEREQWSSGEALSLRSSRGYRASLGGRVLKPACTAAYNDMRKIAGEYIGEDEALQQLEPEDQAHIGMRPGFSRKDKEQREALLELLDGFSDVDELRYWLEGLEQPSNGALGGTFVSDVLEDRTARKYLVLGQADEEKARLYREWTASVRVLPAFATGIKHMSSGELAKRTNTGGGTFQFG